MDTEDLWKELERLGLEEVKRKHFKENEWFRNSDRGRRVEGWIALKESEKASSRSRRAEIVSVVALAVSIIALFIRLISG